MSAENVEIVREMIEAYLAGARSFLRMHPEIVWNPIDEAPVQGVEATIAYMDRWEGEWDPLDTSAEEFEDLGDQVLVKMHFRGVGRASAIEVEADFYEVYTLRDGYVIRMDEFGDRAAALEGTGRIEAR